jgi:hypothetical protein
MAEPVIFDEGGMWVLVKENADSCRLETATADTPTEEPGRGGLLAFVVAAGAVALHLLGGA